MVVGMAEVLARVAAPALPPQPLAVYEAGPDEGDTSPVRASRSMASC